MKALLAVLLLTGCAATAQAPDLPDSVTFTRDQMEDLKAEFEKIANRREREAFQAGVQYQKQACPSLVSR